MEKETCLKTLQYNLQANIMLDEDFKQDIGATRKKAKQALVGALGKFYLRHILRLTNKLRKLKQTKP